MSLPPDWTLSLSHGDTVRLFRRALGYVALFKRDLWIKLGLSFVALLPTVLIPWPIKVVIDHVIGSVPIGEEVTPYPFFVAPFVHALRGASDGQIVFWAVVVELSLLFLLGSFGTGRGERDVMNTELASGQDTATRTENEASWGFSWAGGVLGRIDYRFTMRLTQKLNHYYRSRLYERIQSLPMTTFDDERIGDAVYRVMYDTPAITQVCHRLLFTPIVSPINILMLVSVLASVYGTFSPIVLLALLFLPLVLLVTLPFVGILRVQAARSRLAGSTTTSSIEESLGNIAVVQSLGGHARQRQRFDQDSEASFRAYRLYRLFMALAIVTGVVFGALLVGSVFIYVGDQIIAGKLSPGDLGVLIPYFMGISTSSVMMGGLWLILQDNASGLARVFWLMDLPSEADPPDAAELPKVRESVRVENVSFAYQEGEPVLSNVSFEAKRGELTAFVGPAGAGKTTLAYMIPRFVTPKSGRVLIDGKDIAQVTRASLRSQIAFVFQETTLFDATIAENLRIGKPNATQEELDRAARAAGIYDFIAGLPEGFATRLGRAGGKLSVGQKQRLSIARALVCEAPILIFDEPTSALDPETEALVVRAIEQASRDRIVIVIAHRLSTVRSAGQILFLQGGQVIERGSHRALIANENGAYQRYVRLQAAGA